MSTTFVRVASLYGKHLHLRLKNATKGLDIKELDSLRAVMAAYAYAYQPVRNYFSSAGSAGVFEEWKYNNLSKTFMRLPITLQVPGHQAAMEYAVKRHNLKMGTQLEFVDLKGRGNITIDNGIRCVRACSMYVKDAQGKYKEVASAVLEKDGKFVFTRPLVASSMK